MPLEIGRHAQNVLVLNWRSAADAEAAAAATARHGGSSDGTGDGSGTDGDGSSCRSNCRYRRMMLLQRMVVKVVMLLPYTYYT